MNHLKTLSFTAIPKGERADPILTRREKLIARLEEQKTLAKDPTFAPTITRSIKNSEGIKEMVELKKPLRPNWRTDSKGAIVLTVRYGFKTIEFEKGKAGIAVASKEKLVAVLDTLITAIRQGELDELLAQASKQRGTLKARKAA